MTYTELEEAVAQQGLMLLGGFHPEDKSHMPQWCETLILVGPKPDFWAKFKETPEWQDQAPDAMDRWSERVLLEFAQHFDGEALFPFGGAPFKPFFTWALKSGQAWQSPVNLLVHAQAGLMVSYRGALALKGHVELPARNTSPCDDCHKPCLTACVPRALGPDGYDVPACKAYLASEKGIENKTLGCSVRRSCPLSQSYARMKEQNAYHMRIFLGENR